MAHLFATQLQLLSQTILSKWRFQGASEFTPSSGSGGWEGVNIGSSSILGSQPNYQGGFSGAAYDGRYMYFAPDGSVGTSDYFVRFDTLGPQAAFALKYSDLNSDGYGGDFPGPSMILNTDSGSFNAQSQTQLLPNTWHHLAGTYDSSSLTLRLYIDGALVGSQSTSGSLISTTSNLSIGNLSNGAGYFNGQMNDVQFYNRALTTAEVQSIFSFPLCRGN